MHVVKFLIFHGYLLRGTGSNVYNASLAQALAGLGHEVHLLCQEREAESLPWIRAVGRWEGGRLRVEATGVKSRRKGKVIAYLPDIGSTLPVYVPDVYEGFDARPFGDLDDDEIEHYVAANVGAVRDVAAAAGELGGALANHLVMGPTILGRAGLGAREGGPGFAVKIHGSALEYTVKPDLPRFLPYAREGLSAASGVLVGSRHTAESLWEALADNDLRARTRLGPPGVDTDLFVPIPRRDGPPRLRELAADLAAAGPDSIGWGREPAQAARALEWFADGRGPRVLFVGKLIVSKGIDLLLAAWPLIAAANSGARLLLVGFGEYAEAARRLWAALESGDLAGAREIAARGRTLESGPEGRLRMLEQFLAQPPPGYRDAALAAAGSVAFAGRLEHDEVGRLMPAVEAVVFPSTFPESFGMVAAEAAASGALPVSADHSGLAEVSDTLAEALPMGVADLVSFRLDEDPIAAIAARVNAWLALGEGVRAPAREALRKAVERHWSWRGVARGVIAAAAGKLARLAPVPSRDERQ
jgi:glycosyltransferase involved in cell wall biosynthesis